MDETVAKAAQADDDFKLPHLTDDQAEAYGKLINHCAPVIEKLLAHSQRKDELARKASLPGYFIVGMVVGATAFAGVWAVVVGSVDGQSARELLLPLLGFAGGLAVTKVASR